MESSLFVSLLAGDNVYDYNKIHFDHLRNNINVVKNSKYALLADFDIIMRNSIVHHSFYINYKKNEVVYKDESYRKFNIEKCKFSEIFEKTRNLLALVISMLFMSQYLQEKQFQEYYKIVNSVMGGLL